jgi:hypothetical protein
MQVLTRPSANLLARRRQPLDEQSAICDIVRERDLVHGKAHTAMNASDLTCVKSRTASTVPRTFDDLGLRATSGCSALFSQGERYKKTQNRNAVGSDRRLSSCESCRFEGVQWRLLSLQGVCFYCWRTCSLASPSRWQMCAVVQPLSARGLLTAGRKLGEM